MKYNLKHMQDIYFAHSSKRHVFLYGKDLSTICSEQLSIEEAKKMQTLLEQFIPSVCSTKIEAVGYRLCFIPAKDKTLGYYKDLYFKKTGQELILEPRTGNQIVSSLVTMPEIESLIKFFEGTDVQNLGYASTRTDSDLIQHRVVLTNADPLFKQYKKNIADLTQLKFMQDLYRAQCSEVSTFSYGTGSFQLYSPALNEDKAENMCASLKKFLPNECEVKVEAAEYRLLIDIEQGKSLAYYQQLYFKNTGKQLTLEPRTGEQIVSSLVTQAEATCLLNFFTDKGVQGARLVVTRQPRELIRYQVVVEKPEQIFVHYKKFIAEQLNKFNPPGVNRWKTKESYTLDKGKRTIVSYSCGFDSRSAQTYNQHLQELYPDLRIKMVKFLPGAFNLNNEFEITSMDYETVQALKIPSLKSHALHFFRQSQQLSPPALYWMKK
ncbi:hypothetical protein BN59_02543 [Legionella massiliensis]|uniref:Uncharacterized protein n=1 Tax=Legionella massiliensis TaxID=1034943 RepID=A0A078KUW0_9GAMM|nr:hypothetical protein [Legionella massiliensis]CDZ78235.1 hypothetical protein BN59_02543 [Legionella massiliensis]CEE13973.1 hypothetical protein BN1094_02543 [Legionella massiliensis]